MLDAGYGPGGKTITRHDVSGKTSICNKYLYQNGDADAQHAFRLSFLKTPRNSLIDAFRHKNTLTDAGYKPWQTHTFESQKARKNDDKNTALRLRLQLANMSLVRVQVKVC